MKTIQMTFMQKNMYTICQKYDVIILETGQTREVGCVVDDNSGESLFQLLLSAVRPLADSDDATWTK